MFSSVVQSFGPLTLQRIRDSNADWFSCLAAINEENSRTLRAAQQQVWSFIALEEQKGASHVEFALFATSLSSPPACAGRPPWLAEI